MSNDAILVKKMDIYLRENIRDGEIFINWLYLVPDGADDIDYQDISEDDEQFRRVLKLFARLLIVDNK